MHNRTEDWIYKKVNIRSQGQENWRATAILTFFTAGEKLVPLFIFKAKEDKDTKRN